MSIYATGSIELKSPGGSGTLVITASDSGVVATRPVYVSGSGENNYGKIHNTTGSLSFSTRRTATGEFTDSVVQSKGKGVCRLAHRLAKESLFICHNAFAYLHGEG